jgi:hypothetical protein
LLQTNVYDLRKGWCVQTNKVLEYFFLNSL